MEITKPNDILVASLNNPSATTNDLMSMHLNPDNTSLFSKEDYKASKFIQDKFQTKDGKFDDTTFDAAYNLASAHYKQMSDDEYIKGLDKIQYSPFDVTRPKDAKTFKVDVEFSKDVNPFKQTYGRTGLNSIDESDFSLRQIAQQNKVFDPDTNTWSKESANDLGLMDKLFGSTLVYAQWDADGMHTDSESKRLVNHKKGDWKLDDDGNLFIEKLGQREVYGKQVVNPMDILTTDGSFANKFDVFDSDGKEKSILKTTLQVGLEIAPLLIPEFGIFTGAAAIPSLYGGVKAAVALASVMPTFYKAFEGILLGDDAPTSKLATAAENYMAKYTQTSKSDEGSASLFSYEGLADSAAGIFSLIAEQRALAGLSKIYGGYQMSKIAPKMEAIQSEVSSELFGDLLKSKISVDEYTELAQVAINKIPELESIQKAQSGIAKAISLGYMSLTSSAAVYGEALGAGYDKRTAGFAALAATAGNYAIMANNRMGDWFLDKSTGYTTGANTALMNKTVIGEMDNVAAGLKLTEVDAVAGKKSLAESFNKIKKNINDVFTSQSTVGGEIIKNSLVQGAEMLSIQAVSDATKGMIDTMSYLGMTKKKGSFNTLQNVFSEKGFESYLSTMVGGILGGAVFEFNRTQIEPWLSGKDPIIQDDTKKELYNLVRNGHTEELIKKVNENRANYANKRLAPITVEGDDITTADKGKSQADLVADKTIEQIRILDGLYNSQGLAITDAQIVKKAVTDYLITKDLEKVRGTNKIGIEGIIIDDYNENANKVIDINAHILQLSGTDEDKLKKKAEISELTKEAKVYKEKAENIVNGTSAEDYYNQAIFYLNKQISENWVAIDRDTFSKVKYEKNFSDLPKDGFGITQERVAGEWKDYQNSTDLRANLKVATAAYLQFEKTMNPVIYNYMESGYSKERSDTYKNLIDLNTTINLFNTSTDNETRQAALAHFVDLNNLIEKQTGVRLLPWDAYNSDIFTQLDKLGLVGKMESIQGVDEQGNITTTPTFKNFTKEELGTNVVNKEGAVVPLEEHNKAIIENFFKQFPINPLNAEEIIGMFNSTIDRSNADTLKKLQVLEAKPEKTEQDNANIESLQKSLINLHINSLENTDSIQKLKLDFTGQIQSKLDSLSIDMNQVKEYLELKSNPYTGSSFDDIIDPILQGTENDSEHLDKAEQAKVINAFQQEGILDRYINTLSSDNSKEVIEDLLKYYNSDELEPPTNVEGIFEEIKTGVKDLLSKYSNIENSKDIEEFINFQKEKSTELEGKINEVKPDILKIQNYALKLINDSLKSGSADMEVFREGEKMVINETDVIKDKYFKGFTVDNYSDLIDTINNIKEVSDGILNVRVEAETEEADATILDLLNSSEIPQSFKNILKDSFSETQTLDEANIGGENIDKILSDFNIIKNPTFKNIEDFIKIADSKPKLITNDLYNFIEGFLLSLNSDPNGKTLSVIKILKQEELSLKNASNVLNYAMDGIREINIKQAIDVLKLMKSEVSAMATTEVTYGEPYGFIASRKAFVEKNGLTSDVTGLKTITSDVASLMNKDLDKLITKLTFVKELSKSNSSKIINEQETIRTQLTSIWLNKWERVLEKDIRVNNKSILPDNINELIKNSKVSPELRLLQVENAIYEHNSDKDPKIDQQKKMDALGALIKALTPNSDKLSKIDREVTESSITEYEQAMYFATTLALYSKDQIANNLKLLTSDFDKAPFYVQELAAKMTKASIINPELFSKIIMGKFDKNKENADYITFVLGNTGSGKTSVIFKSIIDNLLQSNSKLSIFLSSPTEQQLGNLHKGAIEGLDQTKLEVTDLDKKALYEKLGISDLIDTILKEANDSHNESNKYVRFNKNGGAGKLDLILSDDWMSEAKVNFDHLPNLLLIDEVTHYSWAEMHILNEISKKSHETSFMKIVAAGDPTQLGYFIDDKGTLFDYNVGRLNGLFTPQLFATVRASNAQQRENSDCLLGLFDSISPFYKTVSNSDELQVAQDKAVARAIESRLSLSYYHDDKTFNGERILDNYNEKVFNTLKWVIDNPDPDKLPKTIGILTNDGIHIDDELSTALKTAGLISAGNTLPDNIKLFTPKNVQGNETDYFIFDTSFLSPFSRMTHKLKAFYTYMSRAKDGSIILDKNHTLKDSFNLSNIAANFPEWREFLSSEVIKETKDARIKTLQELLGSETTPKYDNFKFNKSEVNPEIITAVKLTKHNFNADSVIKLESNYRKPTTLFKNTGEFMGHTFYNNANVANVRENILKGIIEAWNGPKTDLNLVHSLNNKELTEKVYHQWLGLKNSLLFKGKINLLANNNFEFFSNIFNSINDNDTVKVNYVITATKYNKDYNDPYGKYGNSESVLDLKEGNKTSKSFDPNSTLKNDESFINVSAKLSFGDQDHYITLATFPTLKTIEANFENGKDGDNYKMLSKTIENLNTNDNYNNGELVEVGGIDHSDIKVITSTRLLTSDSISPMYLSKLKSNVAGEEQFPGLKTTEIRFFPDDQREFNNLMKRYTFGDPRSQEQLQKNYDTLKNKPYIVASYNDDLEGNATGQETTARLLAIQADLRDYDTTSKEIIDLKTRIAEDFKITNGKSVDPRLNAESDVMLGQTQVLDILIDWATKNTNDGKSILDSLSKQYDLKYVGGTIDKITPMDIIFAFKNDTDSRSKFEEVIKLIKNAHNNLKATYKDQELKDKIKTSILSNVKQFKIWGGKFYNVFDYDKILSVKDNDIFNNALVYFALDESKLIDPSSKSALDEISDFYKDVIHKDLSNRKFYYSIPISSTKNELRVNDYVSGKIDTENGGNLIADKIFIKVIPESPRVVFDFKKVLEKSNIVPGKNNEPITPIEEKKPDVITPKDQIKPPVVDSSKWTSVGDFNEESAINKSTNLISSLQDIKENIDLAKKPEFIDTVNSFINNSRDIVSLDVLKTSFLDLIKSKVIIPEGMRIRPGATDIYLDMWMKQSGITDESKIRKFKQSFNECN